MFDKIKYNNVNRGFHTTRDECFYFIIRASDHGWRVDTD